MKFEMTLFRDEVKVAGDQLAAVMYSLTVEHVVEPEVNYDAITWYSVTVDSMDLYDDNGQQIDVDCTNENDPNVAAALAAFDRDEPEQDELFNAAGLGHNA